MGALDALARVPYVYHSFVHELDSELVVKCSVSVFGQCFVREAGKRLADTIDAARNLNVHNSDSDSAESRQEAPSCLVLPGFDLDDEHCLSLFGWRQRFCL